MSTDFVAKRGDLPLAHKNREVRYLYDKTQGQPSYRVRMMAKAGWCDLLARFPEPHIVVAALPDLTGEESVFTAQSHSDCSCG